MRSPTGVHGKAASGALHEAMSSPDTSGSTLEQSHSNAVTATGESAEKPVHIHDSPGDLQQVQKMAAKEVNSFFFFCGVVNSYLISCLLQKINSQNTKVKLLILLPRC